VKKKVGKNFCCCLFGVDMDGGCVCVLCVNGQGVKVGKCPPKKDASGDGGGPPNDGKWRRIKIPYPAWGDLGDLGAAATEVPSLELEDERIQRRKVCVECGILN
jgi:hypothetical protein